ncbi:MAG TPA: RNA polymerase sigma-70 factor [Thermoanaerobaculia bacterium]
MPDDDSRLTAFDQHRGLLFSIAYRMLGSVADAEDILQETFIRWLQASSDDIRSPKAFLITIITRLSINHLQSARVRREEYVGQWLPEPLILDEGSDPGSLSIAFLVLLERLNPTERAVFLLREVFDYEYAEIAAALGQSEANCRQILRRAKQHVRAERPRFRATEEEHDVLLERFQQAALSGDVGSLEALLSADVVLHTDGGGKAPALPNLVHGANNVARAIVGGITRLTPRNLVQRMVQINGEPGIVTYLNGRPFGVFTIQIREGHIAAVYAITNPDKLSHLPGLPAAPS